ncbi:MAG: type I-U CRISPR-associated protein Cas5/Cas6 [Acidimicrobiaceae bacterium]|nr:type I-U CRISPR-associated protein Cas5/Cas6 [Acidimicrobiaceae bacterium]MYC41435.1 type I-U CRISPR-associated protein Cas5/Cas6 [Acidimicrobiaceae bacterium]MYH88683.1 type I-U CRISPR-associated protein Cas5/Cas6 [Acidimicrobiaceae bacterium]
MAVILRVEFPWGQYHATEWGRNVNEGRPEWPPSHWRILRSLFATWKTRCTHLRAEDVEEALRQLAAPPTFHLPHMRPAHSRHYMPQISHRSFGSGNGKTTLAFDPFAVVGSSEPLQIEWDVELGPSASAALEEIASSVPYLGRSESICKTELVPQVVPSSEVWRPAESGDRVDSEILCPQQPLDMECLVQNPDAVRKQRQILPPGSRSIPYCKVSPAAPDSLDHKIPAMGENWPPVYAAVRLAVHPRPRPTMADAVAVGDLLRRSVMKKHKNPSETLSGKQASGNYTLEGHQHAHYVSLPQDNRREATAPVDALVIWAPRGLNGDEFAALARVKWLAGKRAASRVPDFAVAVNAFGEIGEVAPEFVGPSSVWRSLTPFCPSRHSSKKSWEDHVSDEIERELSVYRSHPKPASVTVLDEDTRRYRRYRLPPKETMASNRSASNVEIRFESPVVGPIILGALCHFGLGLFLPHDNEWPRR